MGKRKYDGEKVEPSKKPNNEEGTVKPQQQVEQNNPLSVNENPSKPHTNRHGFDIKHFRKELATKQGQTMVLTQFLQVCLNPDNEVDHLLEYLKAGGNPHEILRQVTQDNKKNLTLATPAFHLFHLIIMKVQSQLPHMISATEEACRYFLNTFMSTVEIMISENSGPRHRKIILKLLTSMVTLNPDLGVEVLNQAPLTAKHLQYIVEKSNYKEKDNVRTSFVHFMTSFLVDGHLPLIKAVLEKQGLLALVIPGLLQDESEAVLMFLNILKKNVIENSFISKSLKLKTFSHQVLHNLFKVFSWKGPPDLSHESRNESRPDIMQLLSEILHTLFTSHRLGLYFVDTSLGTADANKNQNLYKALLTLKRPWENEYERETILTIVHKCPDLHRAITSVIEHSFEPQHSPIWERTIDFVVSLLDKLKPEDMVPRMASLSSLQVANFVRFITLPLPLLKFIQNNLGKDQTISMYCVKVLGKMLQSLRRYLQILDMNMTNSQHVAELKNRLEYFVPKHLPAPSVVVALIKDIIAGQSKGSSDTSQEYRLPKISDTDSLIYLVDILLLYNDIHPAFFETLDDSMDIKQILDFSGTLSDGNVSLLKFKIVSLWLALDSSAISLKNPMFKDLFLIMLEVYASEDDSTWIEAKETLHKFFKSTSIFEADEDEIHLMLYTLRNSKVNPTSLIGDIVEYVLSNSKELAEYVTNQTVDLEIYDEKSQARLDKLLTDLMEDLNTQDSGFMETKLPSPFIVGCMRFIQNNKDAKKNLKLFLSLYIANLLHSNYSPELTEALMADSKLDIRSYVGSWASEPVPLPENIATKDTTLKNLCKSILTDENIHLRDIFTCLEETEEEKCDFILNELSYKVNISSNMDSSELLIWAKYLIFCTVSLTNLNQLTAEQQKKISDYFECIIALAKAHHMTDACRTIILTLFKNTHFLRIYRPLDLQKDESNILATKFLLQIITRHTDMVTFLNVKHEILQMYQQKNYNEIVKAFTKINKRKNLTTNHTVDVLEVVGLAKGDDLRVFNQIFGADIGTCVKDDKEPSIVLELLRILIEKYSKSIALDLQQGVMKKSLKLYTDLLTNKEVIANLTNLEIALTTYFENKPHHALNVTEDIFKKLFEANTVRKSTAQLASILLKYNAKFCNAFKDQVVKPEILSQRELTLPLGNAVVNHNLFLIVNKDLLKTLYEEYKSNITKLIEKPHKAGQTYIACWKFVKKLVIECMDTEDCQKLFTKIHKYETIESSHIHVWHAAFLKVYLLENENNKNDYLINYLLSTMNLLTNALKESENAEVIKLLAANIYTVTQIPRDIPGFDTEIKDPEKVTASSIWQNFCKSVLKYSLKVKTADQANSCGPQTLNSLTMLIKLLYPVDHEDIPTLFDMVTSHSEFLNVMLSHHSSDIKCRLVEFLYTLISLNKSVMKSQQIPVYLSAYHATRKPCDRLILSVLYFYESNGLPVNEYKPYVFGDSAANHYAVRKNRATSLWAHPTANQVLNLFEKDIIERTLRNFPVMQKMEYNYALPSITESEESAQHSIKASINLMTKDGLFKPHIIKDTEGAISNLITKAKHAKNLSELKQKDLIHVSHLNEDEGIYDPVFLFPLLSHLLAPGSVASCFKLLRTGLLSVPVMALSSHCPMMRASAFHVLHRFCMLLETETKHKNDKLFLTDFFNTLKCSLSTAVTGDTSFDTKNPRIPAVTALYLAKALMVSTDPSDPLYKPVNNFFIAKQTVDLTVVPDFLSLFHDSDVESAERRDWILQVITDGTKTMNDVNVVFKSMCLKMIMDYSSCVLCDRRAQDRILGAINSVVAVPRAFEILVEGYSILPWLHATVRQMLRENKIVKKVFDVLENMLHSLKIVTLARNISNCDKNARNVEMSEVKVNKDVEQKILQILYQLLPLVDRTDNESVSSYTKICSLISKRTIKQLTKNQMLDLVNQCTIKDSETISFLIRSIDKNDAAILKSKYLDTEDELTKQLAVIVKNYLM